MDTAANGAPLDTATHEREFNLYPSLQTAPGSSSGTKARLSAFRHRFSPRLAPESEAISTFKFVTIQQNTKIIGGATHPSVVGPELASFVPSRDMTPPNASVESSAFHLCEFVTKGETDWELVSRGAKGTKFSKL